MKDESLFSDLVDVSVKCVRYKLKYDKLKSETDEVNKLKEIKDEFENYLAKQQNILNKVKNHCDNDEQLYSLYLGTLDVIDYLHTN